MHLFGRALENPPATTSKQSIADERETRAAIGDMAGGMARNIDDLEIETEIRKGNDISAFDRVIDRRDTFSSGTENRNLAQTEKLVHSTDVVTVVVGEEDGGKFQIPLSGEPRYERGLSRIDDYCCWRGRVCDEPNVIVGEGGYRFKKEHLTMLPGNGGLSQSPEDWKGRFCWPWQNADMKTAIFWLLIALKISTRSSISACV